MLQWFPDETKTHAHQWFFPAACVYAVLMVPLAMLARHGYGPGALAAPTGHAFEMLFGFALALIAGYLLGPMPARRLALFIVTWLLARLMGLIDPANWLTLVSNAAFVTLLAWHLLPRLRVAKKWRNRTLVPLLGLICAITIAITLMNQLDYRWLHRFLLDESVQLFALLMLFMGGRMLAPAVAGEFYRQGMELEARVQPHIEAGLIVTVTAAFVLAPIATSVSGVLLIMSGILAAIRLFRWQLWHCLARPDLICLGLGYGWLALGLMLLGWVKLSGGDYFSTAVHAITVGALGTLAANVMVRVTLLHVKQYPSRIPQIVIMTTIMSIAALTRMGADFSAHREILLAIAAVAWSTSFLFVLFVLLDCRTNILQHKSVKQQSLAKDKI
ncbi:NnrS family protein [Nitrosomonas sp. Nm33]|uniref:NnrS family protein n=1 Tax=Nitrosomonas sp. Nm33 TaxID=133724 RepID=UPI002108A94F|nr:NnrS family protein [Nitrosomonas sp. Nm33]